MRMLLILMMLSVPAYAKLLSQAGIKWDDLVRVARLFRGPVKVRPVITGTEMREYVFQTEHGARLAKELAGMSHLAAGHDLQTVFEYDPQWLVWRQFFSAR